MKQSDRPAQAGPDNDKTAAAGHPVSPRLLVEPDDVPVEDGEADDLVAKRAGGKKSQTDKKNTDSKQDEFVAEAGALRRRFFIAVMVPESFTQNLAALKDKGASHWDWKIPREYHISLAFPGALTQSQADRLVTVLSQVEHPSFTLQFKGLSSFVREPGRNRAGSSSVVWASPTPDSDNQLLALHRRIAQAMTDNRFTYGRHDVIPHLTVVKAAMDDNDLLEAFRSAHNHVESLSWECDSFGLYETIERHDAQHPANNNGEGTRYRLVASFPLKKMSPG